MRLTGAASAVLIVEGIDPAGVSLASHFVNLPDHFEGALKTAIFKNGQYRGKLLTGKKMFFPDLILFNDQKFLAFRDLETGQFGYFGSRPGDRLAATMPFRIPQDIQQLLLFIFRD